jgi:hypothetical protein
VSAKVTHAFSEKDKLAVSGYRSGDTFGFAGDTLYNWNSTTASINYLHLFSPDFILDVTGAYSKYDFNVLSKDPNVASTYTNGITAKKIKADFTYMRGSHQLNFGAEATGYVFRQGDLKPASHISQVQPIHLQREQALESALYGSDEVKLSPSLSIIYGLRYSYYATYGAGDVYLYQPGEPKRERTITDTVHYEAGQIVEAFHGAEPRISVNYSLNNKSSLKLGLSRNRQYIHLISNTASVSPTAIWKSSTTYIKPQVGDQVSLGYFRNFKQNTFETSAEVYYKRIQNLPDYKNGARLYLNPTLEADLLQGTGRAYGVEGSLNKNSGKLTGWFSYTYARTETSVKGTTPEETINNGAYYPANYDKPHTLNLVSSYQPRKRAVWSANFTYSTGRPITAPLSHYVIGDYVVPEYGNRNQYRIPAYHRLDLALTILPNPAKQRKWESSWNFSVYNVYGRKNPYSVFFKQVYGSPPRAYQLAVIGVPLPSVSYNFKF